MVHVYRPLVFPVRLLRGSIGVENTALVSVFV